MTHAAVPDRAQHGGLRVALHGVERLAREARHEGGGGGGDGGRAQAMHRLLRPRDGDQGIDAGQGGGGQGGGGVEVAAQRGDGGAGADQVHRAGPHGITPRAGARRIGMEWMGRRALGAARSAFRRCGADLASPRSGAQVT